MRFLFFFHQIFNSIGIFRHYLLDLMRVTPRDANYKGPGSRFCILRPELIAAYCQVNKFMQFVKLHSNTLYN